MKKADKVLFDRAKGRVEESKLDDHSKEGISVALEMAGEACNGMAEAEKIQTMTSALFSLTLAVSYFMAQAPDHTRKVIDEAINGHVGNCAKLIKMQEETARPKRAVPVQAGSYVSLSWKDGLKANGAVAWIFGIIASIATTVAIAVFSVMWIQEGMMKKAVNEIMDIKMQQLKQEVAK